MNIWLTTDQKNTLQVWDIENEILKYKIEHKKIDHTIVDVVGLSTLRLIAVASLDKIVTIWDFEANHLVLEINLPKGGVHSMVFSHSF